MSEFLAEASVLIRPDTSRFRADLQKQLLAATTNIAPITVPITAAAATGVAAASAATAALQSAQTRLEASTLGLTTDMAALARTYGLTTAQLQALTLATGEAAGAQSVLDKTTKGGLGSLLGAQGATSKLNAALLGLRTAVGSSAVIGLSALALGAIAAGKGLRAMISIAAALETELNTFQAVTGATADEMERVSAAATRLGADISLPAVSASDAAVAMTELAKAGLSVEDAISGAEGVLQLATAAQISQAEAATIAANALNSFGLAGTEAAKVADAFANAANAAQGSISDIGLALRQSSAVARQVGLNLNDTVAILSLFAKNGLTASDAGTSLRVALIRLVAPTAAARDEIRKLGLQVRDAQGNLRPDIFAQFGEATRELGPAARDAAAQLIFGQDAIRAVSIGAREGTDGLRLMQFEIDQTGTAADVAAARTRGFAGEMQALNSNLQTLGASTGRVINSFLTPLLKGLNELAEGANKAAGAIEDLFNRLDEEASSGGGRFGDFLAGIGGGVNDLIGRSGLGGARQRVRDFADDLSIAADEGLSTSQKIRTLTNELKQLEKARIGAQAGGQGGVADALTIAIEDVRQQIRDLKKEAGEIVLAPDTRKAIKPLQDAIDRLNKARGFQLVIGADTSAVDALISALEARIRDLEGSSRAATDAEHGLGQALNGVANAAGSTKTAVDSAAQAIKNLTRESARASDQLLKAQNEGASPGVQIGILQQDIQTQQQIIAEAKKGGITAGEPTIIRKAREQINRDQAEIESLQAEIKSDQQEAVRKAQQAADNAAKLANEQTQAFIEQFGGGKNRRLNQAKLDAGITDSLADDIAVNERIRTFLRNKIKAIQNRIRNLHLTGDALKTAQAAIKTALDEIDRITADINKDTADFLQQQQQNIIRRLDLRIELAQINENVPKQIQLHKQKLAALRKQLKDLQKAHKGNTLEALQLKVDIANEIKAINDLKPEVKEQGNAFKELTFEFLQAQQGFAANLLGNLIPGGMTGGLVGGSSPASDAMGMLSAGQKPESLLGTQASVSDARASGPAAALTSRVDTTNALLTQIRNALRPDRRQPPHPEARYQYTTSGGALDTM